MKLSSLIRHPYFAPFSLQTVLAFQWIFAGLEKIHAEQFVSTIGKTLSRFENGNPHDWYVGSVLRIAKSYPVTFGMLVQWGEFLAGIGLFVALVLYIFSKQRSTKTLARLIGIAALAAGVFMNVNFYLAAGWTSPSTAGINALMFWMQFVLFLTWVVIPRTDRP